MWSTQVDCNGMFTEPTVRVWVVTEVKGEWVFLKNNSQKASERFHRLLYVRIWTYTFFYIRTQSSETLYFCKGEPRKDMAAVLEKSCFENSTSPRSMLFSQREETQIFVSLASFHVCASWEIEARKRDAPRGSASFFFSSVGRDYDSTQAGAESLLNVAFGS